MQALEGGSHGLQDRWQDGEAQLSYRAGNQGRKSTIGS